MKYYLAVDIGASGGRHILGHLSGGRLIAEEIYRFDNDMSEKDGEMCWDYGHLFREILEGMRRCKTLGKTPHSVGIDTWAVDFVLLDSCDEIIGSTVAYRDGRTQGADELVYAAITEAELYARTGIQKQIFNTVYQLASLRRDKPEQLSAAKAMLLTPDYFHFLLSGKKATEYTNATTTQLVSPATRGWDEELISLLGFPCDIFMPVAPPGAELGSLTQAVIDAVGYNCRVVLPATHDTASAVLAVPAQGDALYISSGTWSLIGTERDAADCSPKSREYNFTSEGGYGYRYRHLKNIMGLWMIQSVVKETGCAMSYAELCAAAARVNIKSRVDCNDSRFLAPDSMVREIEDYCRKTSQQIPKTVPEYASVIYNSLAVCYAAAVQEIEELTGKTYADIHIVGGGSSAGYLNGLTAKYTKKRVVAGPKEATAIGNIAAQMIAAGELADIYDARECIGKSFEIEVFESEEFKP